MKLEQIDNHEKVDRKIMRLIISNHGNKYIITSDFLGIKITQADCERIVVHPEATNSIVIK